MGCSRSQSRVIKTGCGVLRRVGLEFWVVGSRVEDLECRKVDVEHDTHVSVRPRMLVEGVEVSEFRV